MATGYPYNISNIVSVGFAKETTYNTPVAATNWLPVKGIGIEIDPANIYPKVMRGVRADQFNAVAGIRKIAGPLNFPLFPDAGISFLVGAIGTEQYTTGSTPTNATTLAALAAAGAATISSTATFAPNSWIQIDTSASKKSEARKVSSVSGAGPYTITLDKVTNFAHSNGAAVTNVVAPYTHNIILATTLPTWTIEKQMSPASANSLDLQYAGCLVNKYDLKLAMNAEADATATFEGTSGLVLGSPGTPAWPTDLPISPTQIAVSFNGTTDITVDTANLSIDNKGKVYPAMNSLTTPAAVVATAPTISLKGSLLLQALSGGAGASLGYFADLASVPTYAAQLVITQGTNVITLALPNASLMKLSNPIRLGDFIKYDLDYNALFDTTSGNIVTATIVNTSWLPY